MISQSNMKHKVCTSHPMRLLGLTVVFFNLMIFACYTQAYSIKRSTYPEAWFNAFNQAQDNPQRKKSLEEMISHISADLKQLKSSRLVDTQSQQWALFWRGIAYFHHAGLSGGIIAIRSSQKARVDFERVFEQNPSYENGSLAAYLGLLYAKAPPWPLGLRDAQKAQQYMSQAQKVGQFNPEVQYLAALWNHKKNNRDQMLKHLNQMTALKPRPEFEMIDITRKHEANEIVKLLLAL
jgi:hypothetical protein